MEGNKASISESSHNTIRREHCREDLADGERCNAPAEFILWGKLLPPEALGPRCYDHAAKHVGSHALGDPAWAIYDLRKVDRLVARQAELEAERDDLLGHAVSHVAANADLAERVQQLEDALRRVTHNFRLAVAGKPVRDMAETLAEVDAALESQ